MATESVMFGAGCFWGVEHAFRQVPGVLDAICGYSGGSTEDPSYEQVCSGATGHAEVVQVEFDPSQVSFEKLLETFFGCHKPTELNRQGPDIGTQYRSAIFYSTEAQREASEQAKASEDASGKWNKPVVTEIAAAGSFYRAEEYHQRYFEKTGRMSCGI